MHQFDRPSLALREDPIHTSLDSSVHTCVHTSIHTSIHTSFHTSFHTLLSHLSSGARGGRALDGIPRQRRPGEHSERAQRNRRRLPHARHETLWLLPLRSRRACSLPAAALRSLHAVLSLSLRSRVWPVQARVHWASPGADPDDTGGKEWQSLDELRPTPPDPPVIR